METKLRIKVTVRDIINQTCQANDCPELSALITYEWSNRLTTTIGKAYCNRNRKTWRIKLSRPLFAKADTEERKNTVAHETCHLIVWYKYNEYHTNPHASHGYTWRKCMIEAGYTPSRYHNVPVQRRKISQVTVYCGCGPIKITKHRHTKMLNGSTYKCCRCNHNLRLYEDKQLPSVNFANLRNRKRN